MKVQCIRIGSVRLCLALMLGLLAVSGYVVAPVLFAKAGSVSTAGMLAGEIFHVANFGLMLLSAAVAMLWFSMRNGGFQIGRIRWLLLIALAVLIVGNEFAVSPILADLKAEIGPMDMVSRDDPLRQKFGMWHGVSAVIHLGAAIAAALMVALGPFRRGASCPS